MGRYLGNRLIAALQKRTDKVIYFCSVENVSLNLVVNEIRKSLKRMRALLKFYDNAPDEFSKMYRTQFKIHGKNLAKLRESFINIQIFERLSASNNLIPERIIKVAKEKFLNKNRILIEDDFFKQNSCSSILQLMKQFEFQLLKLKIDWPSKKQLREKICVSYGKSYKCYLNFEPGLNGGMLHDFRKKLKVLLYQMNFLKFMHPKYFKMKSNQLNKITDQLGEDHDLFIFLNEIKQKEYGLEQFEIDIFETQIQHLRELNELKLSARLKQLFREAPEVFNEKMELIFYVSDE